MEEVSKNRRRNGALLPTHSSVTGEHAKTMWDPKWDHLSNGGRYLSITTPESSKRKPPPPGIKDALASTWDGDLHSSVTLVFEEASSSLGGGLSCLLFFGFG